MFTWQQMQSIVNIHIQYYPKAWEDWILSFFHLAPVWKHVFGCSWCTKIANFFFFRRLGPTSILESSILIGLITGFQLAALVYVEPWAVSRVRLCHTHAQLVAGERENGRSMYAWTNMFYSLDYSVGIRSPISKRIMHKLQHCALLSGM